MLLYYQKKRKILEVKKTLIISNSELQKDIKYKIKLDIRITNLIYHLTAVSNWFKITIK